MWELSSMCWICRIFSIRSNVNANLGKLKSALKMISHRGPDELRFVAPDNHFCGGTVRLAIEALGLGEQPVTSGDITIGFNGKIFNYKHLTKYYQLGDEAVTVEYDGGKAIYTGLVKNIEAALIPNLQENPFCLVTDKDDR